jgi:tetratricopeptide (TPR) repeat protein
VVLVCLAVFSGLWMVRSFVVEEKSRYTLAEDFGNNVTKNIPRDSFLLADGDNYVMSIWYEKYVLGKRKDLIFEPSVFLYHSWGWDQIIQQSQDLKPAIDSSGTFEGRLEALTLSPFRHHFFYSLGQEYLWKVLERVPGVWSPKGLAYEWMKNSSDSWVLSDEVFAASDRERFRGISLSGPLNDEDPATRDIYRYYADQHFVTPQKLHQISADWLALKQFDRGLNFYRDNPSVYSDMGVILGKMGYLEMARRLFLMGIQADSNYLFNYINLANIEILEGHFLGAVDWYKKALPFSSSPDMIQNRILELQNSSPRKPSTLLSDKSSGDYNNFGKRCEKEGLGFLGNMAFQIAEGIPSEY